MGNAVIVVFGNTTEDVFLDVVRFGTTGESVLARHALRDVGGKGANQAVAAARAGADVTFVTAVGDDEAGGRLAGRLEGEPNLTLRIARRSCASDMSFIQVRADGQNIVVSTNACVRTLDPGRLTEIEMGPGDMLLLQGNLDPPVTFEAMRVARSKGAGVALNPSPFVGELDRFRPWCDLLVLNEHEAAALVDGDDMVRAMRRWVASGPGDAVLTLGSRGAVWYGRDEDVACPAPVVDVVDTTGAGDVFCGVLLAGTQRGESRNRALDRAVRAATLATTRRGAYSSIPRPDELETL
jgi:ribokinase